MKDAPALGRAAQRWGLVLLRNNDTEEPELRGAWRTDKKYVADALLQQLGTRHENPIRKS